VSRSEQAPLSARLPTTSEVEQPVVSGVIVKLTSEMSKKKWSVTSAVLAVLRCLEHRTRTLDGVLGIMYAGFKGFFLADQHGHQFGGIRITAAHFGKMDFVPQCFLGKFCDVVNFTDGHNAKCTQMRSDNQGLIIMVADDPDTHVAVQLWKIRFKFGPEIIPFDIVNGALDFLGVFHRQSASFCAEMGMIIGSIKQVVDTIFFRYTAEQATHKHLSVKS
jgi:hypothetical protein